MSRYVRGARFERRVRDYLENLGFFVVRAASSKPIDLICVKNGKALTIECKTSIRGITESVFKGLREISLKTGAKTLIATKKGSKIIFIDPDSGKEVDIGLLKI